MQYSDSQNPRVYFEFEMTGKSKGMMVFELFKNVTPKTAENFRQLCTGESLRKDKLTGKPLSYQNSTFHRIIRTFMCQGGDFIRHNGTGGESIYGKTFSDENFKIRHSSRGLLSMANCGPHTNSSQFFITFGQAPWLDNKHVVFGRVERGKDILTHIEGQKTDQYDKPRDPVKVIKCGMMRARTQNDPPLKFEGKDYAWVVDDRPIQSDLGIDGNGNMGKNAANSKVNSRSKAIQKKKKHHSKKDKKNKKKFEKNKDTSRLNGSSSSQQQVDNDKGNNDVVCEDIKDE